MDEYEKYETDRKNQQKANKSLLGEFEEWLKTSGLSEKTIRNHRSNIDFYINEFLLYDEINEPQNGIHDIGMFLGYWFIKKAMWASVSSIKGNATSLKKFYTFMHNQGQVDQADLTALKQRIKEDMPEWLATLKRYDDPYEEDVWW